MKDILLLIGVCVLTLVVGFILTLLPVAFIMYLISLTGLITFSWLWAIIITLILCVLSKAFKSKIVINKK